MLTTYRQAYKTMVYAEISAGNKIPVGVFLDFVINPDSGVMEYCWIQTLQGKKILDPADILHWRSSEILINDANSCRTPEKIPKLKKLFAKEFPILGVNVYSWPGKKYLGQVRNFGFDTISPRLLSLHIQPRWWQPWRRVIVSHQRIQIISDKGIFIHNQTTVKTDKPVKKIAEVVKEIPKTDCEE